MEKCSYTQVVCECGEKMLRTEVREWGKRGGGGEVMGCMQ